MKHALLLTGVLLGYLPAAVSVTFNTDALKSMQQEGHKIAEQAKALRAFKLLNNKCLHAAGNLGKAGTNVEFHDCNADTNNQKWRFDGEGRLVNQGGKCLGVAGDPKKPGANVLLQDCGGAKAQRWREERKDHVANGANRCLHAAGTAKTVAGNVVTMDCKDIPNQVWQ